MQQYPSDHYDGSRYNDENYQYGVEQAVFASTNAFTGRQDRSNHQTQQQFNPFETSINQRPGSIFDQIQKLPSYRPPSHRDHELMGNHFDEEQTWQHQIQEPRAASIDEIQQRILPQTHDEDQIQKMLDEQDYILQTQKQFIQDHRLLITQNQNTNFENPLFMQEQGSINRQISPISNYSQAVTVHNHQPLINALTNHNQQYGGGVSNQPQTILKKTKPQLQQSQQVSQEKKPQILKYHKLNLDWPDISIPAVGSSTLNQKLKLKIKPVKKVVPLLTTSLPDKSVENSLDKTNKIVFVQEKKIENAKTTYSKYVPLYLGSSPLKKKLSKIESQQTEEIQVENQTEEKEKVVKNQFFVLEDQQQIKQPEQIQEIIEYKSQQINMPIGPIDYVSMLLKDHNQQLELDKIKNNLEIPDNNLQQNVEYLSLSYHTVIPYEQFAGVSELEQISFNLTKIQLELNQKLEPQSKEQEMQTIVSEGHHERIQSQSIVSLKSKKEDLIQQSFINQIEIQATNLTELKVEQNQEVETQQIEKQEIEAINEVQTVRTQVSKIIEKEENGPKQEVGITLVTEQPEVVIQEDKEKEVEVKAVLLHFVGEVRPKVFRAELNASSLNEGDVFVIEVQELNIMYFWVGQDCSENRKNNCFELCEKISKCKTKSTQSQIFKTYQNQEYENEFWKYIGGKPEKINPSILNASLGDLEDTRYRLFKISDESGTMKTTELKDRPLIKSHLNINDIFLLEEDFQIYIWIGSNSNTAERKNANQIGQSFVQRFNKHKETIVTHLDDGEESECFKSFFDWQVLIKEKQEEIKKVEVVEIKKEPQQMNKTEIANVMKNYKESLKKAKEEKIVEVKKEEEKPPKMSKTEISDVMKNYKESLKKVEKPKIQEEQPKIEKEQPKPQQMNKTEIANVMKNYKESLKKKPQPEVGKVEEILIQGDMLANKQPFDQVIIPSVVVQEQPDLNLVVKQPEKKDSLISEEYRENLFLAKEFVDQILQQRAQDEFRIMKNNDKLPRIKDESIKAKEQIIQVRDNSIIIKEEIAKEKEHSENIQKEIIKVKEQSIKLKEDILFIQEESINIKNEIAKVNDESVKMISEQHDLNRSSYTQQNEIIKDQSQPNMSNTVVFVPYMCPEPKSLKNSTGSFNISEKIQIPLNISKAYDIEILPQEPIITQNINNIQIDTQQIQSLREPFAPSLIKQSSEQSLNMNQSDMYSKQLTGNFTFRQQNSLKGNQITSETNEQSGDDENTKQLITSIQAFIDNQVEYNYDGSEQISEEQNLIDQKKEALMRIEEYKRALQKQYANLGNSTPRTKNKSNNEIYEQVNLDSVLENEYTEQEISSNQNDESQQSIQKRDENEMNLNYIDNRYMIPQNAQFYGQSVMQPFLPPLNLMNNQPYLIQQHPLTYSMINPVPINYNQQYVAPISQPLPLPNEQIEIIVEIQNITCVSEKICMERIAQEIANDNLSNQISLKSRVSLQLLSNRNMTIQNENQQIKISGSQQNDSQRSVNEMLQEKVVRMSQRDIRIKKLKFESTESIQKAKQKTDNSCEESDDGYFKQYTRQYTLKQQNIAKQNSERNSKQSCKVSGLSSEWMNDQSFCDSNQSKPLQQIKPVEQLVYQKRQLPSKPPIVHKIDFKQSQPQISDPINSESFWLTEFPSYRGQKAIEQINIKQISQFESEQFLCRRLSSRRSSACIVKQDAELQYLKTLNELNLMKIPSNFSQKSKFVTTTMTEKSGSSFSVKTLNTQKSFQTLSSYKTDQCLLPPMPKQNKDKNKEKQLIREHQKFTTTLAEQKSQWREKEQSYRLN